MEGKLNSAGRSTAEPCGYLFGGIPANREGRRFIAGLRRYLNKGAVRGFRVRANGPRDRGQRDTPMEKATSLRVYLPTVEAEQWRARYMTAVDSLEGWRMRAATLTAERDELKGERNRAEDALSNVRDAWTAETLKRVEAEAELDRVRTELGNTMADRDEYRASLSAAERDRDEAQSRARNLEADLAKEMRGTRALARERNTLADELTRVEANHRAALADLDTSQRQRRALLKDLAGTVATLYERRAELEEAKRVAAEVAANAKRDLDMAREDRDEWRLRASNHALKAARAEVDSTMAEAELAGIPKWVRSLFRFVADIRAYGMRGAL